MSVSLKVTLSLGLVIALASLAGCSSAPSGTTAPRAQELPSTAPAPTERYLATLTLDADSTVLYAEPSASSSPLGTLSSGDQLFLIQRLVDWLKVQTASGAIGFIQNSALVAPACITDRAEPRVLEAPFFAFKKDGPHGNVVIEAEFDANGQILNTRVLENSVADPTAETEALSDLHRIRFLPPTKDCKPRPFFYTFTRQF